MKSVLIISLGVCFLTLSAAIQKELHATTKNVASQQQKKISSPKLSKKKEFQQKISTAMNKRHENIHAHEVVGSMPPSPHHAAMKYYAPDDSTCSGKPVQVTTVLLDTCLKENKKGDSIKFSCDGGVPHKITYSDDACQTQVDSQNGPTTCDQNKDQSYWWIDCNFDNVNLPDDTSYFAETHYATSPCTDNQVITSDYYLNDYCFPAGEGMSWKWSWPYVFGYDNDFCIGEYSNGYNLDDFNCLIQDYANDDDAGVFENTYTSFYNVGPMPHHPKFAIRGFRNGDHHTDKYPGNVEVHCFELRADGSAASVRGTYGQRGFFEGIIVDDSMNSHTASVNFYEVGYIGNDDLYVSTGTGLLQYDDSWNYNGGFYYSSGFESMSVNNSISDWGIDPNWGCGDDIRGCLGLDQSVSDIEIAHQYCLWDATGKKGYNFENVDYKPWWIFGKENPNTWYPTGLGYNALTVGGPVVGAYRYTYTKDDCKDLNCKKDGNVEWGVYGLDTNIAQVGSGFIINTIWYASTGPFKNRNGATLYALVAGPGGKKQQIIGFFCNSKKNNDPNIWAGKVLTDCSYDNNMSQKPNKNLAVQLFQTYAKFGKWFEQWNTWATSVFGMGQGSNQQNQQQPTVAHNVHVNAAESVAADAPAKKSWVHAMKGYFRGENN